MWYDPQRLDYVTIRCNPQNYQSKAARCGRLTDGFWGIENGLNNFLIALEPSVTIDPQEFQNSIDRAIATGSRLERNRARLRREFLSQDPECLEEQRMLARISLAEIRSAVSAAEWALLNAVAAGTTYHEIAASQGVSAGGVRTRVSRLRMRLAKEITRRTAAN